MENTVDKPAGDTDLLSKLVGYYEEFEENTWDSRADAERNRDYYDNKQLTQEEEAALKERGQPIVIFNLVARTINALIGLEDEKTVDPKALPRTPNHEEDAEAITDALRYVCDNTDFDATSLAGFENLLIEGTEGVEVNVADVGGEYEIQTTHIMWDRMFWDIHSRRKDFSDAKYKGIIIWMDWEDARAKAKREGWDMDALNATTTNTEIVVWNETHDDKPRYKWNDHERKRVKICLIHYIEDGQWHYAYFSKGGILRGGPIPFNDEHGQPESSLEFQSAFVDRDGNRYGYVQALIDPQDEVNKRRSKGLHLITQRQTYGNQAAGVDVDEVKRELAKPDGHVDMKNGQFGTDFGIIPTNDMTAGNFQMLTEAKAMFDVVGANTSVTGKEDRVMSGRAEIVRDQKGARELVPVMFAHSQWRKRVYRQQYNRIKQFWTGERWVRVTDDEKNLRFVGLNQPITLGEQLEADGELELLAQLEMMGDPRLMQPVGVRNEVSELDMDIMLEESPDVANIQHEQFELVANLYQANPDAIPFDEIIRLSSLRGKERFLERIEAQREAQGQAATAAQEKAELDRMEQLAEIDKTRSEADKNNAAAMSDMVEAQTAFAFN